MLFPNQLRLMLECLNVDVVKSGESLSVPRTREALEACSGCNDVPKCRGWFMGDINNPRYRTFCINAGWLDTLPRRGPPTRVKLDAVPVDIGKQPEADMSPLQRQFLEQLNMSGDISIVIDDKTTTLWRTVNECRKKGWVNVKEISPGIFRLRLNSAPALISPE